MSEPLYTDVVCPHCQTVNRIPRARLGERPKCGQCHQPIFTGQPLTLTESDFERQIQHTEIPLLVDFWADWCGPCKMMAPAFAEAAGQLEPNVRLAKVDTDSERGLAARFGIRSIPTLILFRDGRELARQSGAMGTAQIVHWVESNL